MNFLSQQSAMRQHLLTRAPLITVFLVTAILSAFTESEENLRVDRPNIVFIFADDMGYGDIGLFGAKNISTPNIDALGNQGIIFREFYAISPVCSPSRAGLLTGRYPIRMGIQHVFFPHSLTGMPTEELTIAELLRDAGYRTGMVGKWHLGHRQEFLPLNHGFDEFFGMPYSNDMHPYPYMRGNDFIEQAIDQSTLTQRLTEEATAFIKSHRHEPFFLYIAHAMPHIPLFRSEQFQGKSNGGPYGDVVEELDWSVGEIVKTLSSENVLENTLVVFTSDNGPWLLMGKDGGSAGPLRNGKGSTFEGGMRVPTVAMWRGNIPPGRISHSPATMLDWLPTIATLAGAALPQDRTIDGMDISSLLTGGEPDDQAPRQIAYYLFGDLQAFRLGDWKVKLPFDGLRIPSAMRFLLRFTPGFETHDLLLFNLKNDPGETKNLADTYPDKTKELLAVMAAFKHSLGALPPNINEFPGLRIEGATKVIAITALKVIGVILLLLLVLCLALAYLFGRYRRGHTKDS